MPAAGIERLVLDQFGAFLASPDAARIIAAADDAQADHPLYAVEHHRLLQVARSLASTDPVAKRGLLLQAIDNAQVHRDRVEISIDRRGIRQQLSSGDPAGFAVDGDVDRSDAKNVGGTDHQAPSTPTATPGQPEPRDVILLTVPVAFRRSGFEQRLVVPGTPPSALPDPRLIRLLARAHRVRDKLFADPEHNITSMAAQERLTPSYLTRLLRLAFLAPDITTALLKGRQPIELTANKLMADTRLPIDWAEQRRELGFE